MKEMLRRLALYCACFTAACTSSTPVAPVADVGPSDAGASCNASSIAQLAVRNLDPDNALDPLGYPPYTADGCTIAYVRASDRALVLRSLTTGDEELLASAEVLPRRPSMSQGSLVWEATIEGLPTVMVRAGGIVTPIHSAAHHAGEPRIHGGSVVFTGWLSADEQGDTDIFLYDIASGALSVAGGGPGQQRFADVSDSLVAYADFSEGGDAGAFDRDAYSAADIVVVNRQSGIATTRKLTGKQAFPLIAGDNLVGYLDWGLVHPEPKLSMYAFKVGDVSGEPASDRVVSEGPILYPASVYLRPSVQNGRFAWAENDQLFIRGADLSREATVYSSESHATLLGPVLSDRWAIVSENTGTTTALSLRAFEAQ